MMAGRSRTCQQKAKLQGWATACQLSPNTVGRSTLCALEGLFREFVGNEISKQILNLFGSTMGVIALYCFFQGGKGGRSIAFHPLVTIAWTSLGQLFGVGVAGPIILPALLALTKALEPAHVGLPPPPTKTYTCTALLAQVLVIIVAGSMTGIPTSSPHWWTAQFIFQIFPLFFLPLVFLPLSKNSSTDAPPSKLCANTFRVLFWLQLPNYWITVFSALKAYGTDNVPILDSTAFLLWDFAGCLTIFFAIVAIDFISGDARGTIDPGQLAAYFLLAGPAAAAAAYFEAQELKHVKRANLKLEHKL